MTVIICCNDSFSAYNFRLNLIKALISKGYQLYVLCGYDNYTYKLQLEGVRVININIEKTGKNILSDYRLYLEIKKQIKILKPSVLINYTIKPHIYATLAARNKNIKIINFIAGVGSMFLKDNLIKRIIIFLYRHISRYVWGYIFLNKTDFTDFSKYKILRKNKVFFVASEGVDLNLFKYQKTDSYDIINFIFVGRLVKEKGLLEYLQVSEIIKREYKNVNFYIAGKLYEKKNSSIDIQIINLYQKKGLIKYLGFCEQMNEIYRNMHALVLPSYREGMPISLIEGFAMGKIAIASNVAGCKDIIDDSQNGFLFEPKNLVSLQMAIKKYLALPTQKKVLMSQNAFEKASKEYDVKRIVPYLVNIIEMDKNNG